MSAKIGLALGGGGARGLAHIGILKVFQQEKIPIYQITGSSIGALIGGLFAAFKEAGMVEQFVKDFIHRPVFNELDIQIFNAMDREKAEKHFNDYLNNLKMYFSFLKTLNTVSIYNEELITKMFEEYPDLPIEKLPLRFAAIATDLISGREIALTEGSLKQAVMASSAIPGIFPPVKIDRLRLVDGSTSDSIPVQVVKGQGAQFVFAVDVGKCVEDLGPLNNGLQIIYRAEDIVTYHLTQERLATADLVIRPRVRHFSWAAVNRFGEIIAAGEQAAREALPQIERILKILD